MIDECTVLEQDRTLFNHYAAAGSKNTAKHVLRNSWGKNKPGFLGGPGITLLGGDKKLRN